MIIAQHQMIDNTWTDLPGFSVPENGLVQLVLAFGATDCVTEPGVYNYIKAKYPNADIVISSTSGEIINDAVYDNSVVVTAVQFEKSSIRTVLQELDEKRGSYETGKLLMNELNAEGLRCVFVISDGTYINGSELVAGFNENNEAGIAITGGLAGDAARFAKTYTGLNAVPTRGNVIAIGFYGNGLLTGHGSFGGWDEFGHERTITKSDKNVLFEIDGKSALSLYKEYLGDYVNDLPGSALLFPLALKAEDNNGILVRTILSVDEESNSMTFAGNMPVGGKVRLMKANFDRLIEGASNAANFSFIKLVENQPQLAILVSCVGRKLVLQQRIDEEVEAAKEILGNNTAICGFYSYGEISPINPNFKCELHNQTMTITTLAESL